MADKTERRRVLDEMLVVARRLDALKVRLAELDGDESDGDQDLEAETVVDVRDPPTIPVGAAAPRHGEGQEVAISDRDSQTRSEGSSRPRLLVPAPKVSLEGVQIRSAPDAAEFSQRYTAGESLGEGGMGEVRVFLDKRIGREVAMKMIVPEARKSSRHRERFLFEARVQGQLEHPSIVPVYDLGQLPDDSSYFTMKRVKGETLRQIINDLRAGSRAAAAAYTRRRLLQAFQSICLAVDFAHQRGVLHRDIKPTNIMLGAFGEVSLLDWGVAKLCETEASTQSGHTKIERDHEATAVGEVLGTPGYMSPEQAAGERDLDARSDVFSLGAILFEILTLERLVPYQEGDLTELTLLGGYDAHISERFPQLDVPPELEAICVAATEHDLEKRTRSVREIHEAVERYLDGETDDKRRRSLSRKHTRAAIAALSEAAELEGKAHRDEAAADAARERRQSAAAEVTRALALDPDNRVALQTMIKLQTELPQHPSKAALAAIEASEAAGFRQVSRRGGAAFVLVAANLALAVFLGVKSPVAFAVPILLLLGAAAIAAYASRGERPDMRMAMPVVVLSSVAFALTSAMYGPYTFAPTMCAMNVVLYAVFLDRPTRLFAMGCGIAAIILPIVLQGAGLVPASWIFRDGIVELVPQVVAFPELGTTLFLTLVLSGAVIVPTLLVGAERDARVKAERQLTLQAHQLAELLPPEARVPVGLGDSVPPPSARDPLSSVHTGSS